MEQEQTGEVKVTDTLILKGQLVKDGAGKEWVLLDPAIQPYQMKMTDEATMTVSNLN